MKKFPGLLNRETLGWMKKYEKKMKRKYIYIYILRCLKKINWKKINMIRGSWNIFFSQMRKESVENFNFFYYDNDIFTEFNRNHVVENKFVILHLIE